MTDLICALVVIALSFWILWGDDPDTDFPPSDAASSPPKGAAHPRTGATSSGADPEMRGGPLSGSGEWCGRFNFAASAGTPDGTDNPGDTSARRRWPAKTLFSTWRQS